MTKQNTNTIMLVIAVLVVIGMSLMPVRFGLATVDDSSGEASGGKSQFFRPGPSLGFPGQGPLHSNFPPMYRGPGSGFEDNNNNDSPATTDDDSTTDNNPSSSIPSNDDVGNMLDKADQWIKRGQHLSSCGVGDLACTISPP
jgi:hypothetical protein